MKHTLHVLAIGALGLGLAACGGNSNNPGHIVPGGGSGANTTQYKQIELLSRPAVKELFEKFVDHQTTNAAEPYADTTLQGEIQSFTDALRPPNTAVGSDYGKALAGVLYPNWLTVDLSQTGAAAYLGNETGGATSTSHSTFGGRALTDDVITISLGAVFGKTLATLHLQPEDNEENNCLTTQNLAISATQAPTSTFPYLHAPH
ncbi:MAG TPA: DUF4331 family protein [Candidatus Aquilonibacter sp.]